MNGNGTPINLEQLFDDIFREEMLPIIEARFPRHDPLLEPLYYTLESTPRHFAGGVPYLVSRISGIENGPALSALVEVLYSVGVILDDFCDGTRDRRGLKTCHMHFGGNRIKRFLPFAATLIYEFLIQEGFDREIESSYRKMIILTLQAAEELETFSLTTDLETFLRNGQTRNSFLIWAVDVACGSSPYKVALGEYERNLAVAGQLKNDLRDLHCEGCNDVVHAQPTYPLALLYTKMPLDEKEQFLRQFKPNACSEVTQFILTKVQEYRIFEDCLALINTYVERALAALSQVRECYEKEALSVFARSHTRV